MTKGKKVLLIFGAFGAMGVGSYFLARNKPTSTIAQFWTGILGSKLTVSGNSTTGNVPKLNEVRPVVQTSSTVNSSNFESEFPNCRGYRREVFPIGNGMKGVVVRDIQKVLNTRHRESLSVDGCYGSKTTSAVKRVLGTSTVSTDGFIELKGGERAKPVDAFDFNPLNWF